MAVTSSRPFSPNLELLTLALPSSPKNFPMHNNSTGQPLLSPTGHLSALSVCKVAGAERQYETDHDPEAGEETLQAVLNGDAEAFRSILRSYGPRVERLVSAHVLPHEVPEVAQETFVRAYRSLRSYQGQGSFERWLATIALRCCYERLRERYRTEAPFSSLARSEEDEPEGLTDQASFRLHEEENQRRDLREELESALQSLEPRDRMLLTLTFLEGYSIAETAAMMDMTPINVRSGSTVARQSCARRSDPLGKPGRQS